MGHKSFMRHIAEQGLSAALLITTSLVLMALFAIANKIEPGIGLLMCRLVLPRMPEGDAGVYIAFRLSLYAFASLVSLLLMLAVVLWGLKDPRPQDRDRPPRWRMMLFVAVLVPIVWLGYPFYALSMDYPVVNDLGYFLLTAVIFSGLPLLAHVFSWRYGRKRKRAAETIYQVRL